MTAKRYISMLLVMLVSVTGTYAQVSFIKDVKVRVGEKNQYSDLTSEGYTVISGSSETYFDFNGGGTGGDYVYIGYKTTTNPNEAISDLAIVYNNSGTSTAYGSDDFLYGGSKTMMIGSKRYYLAPHSGGPDMNNRNDKHNNCVYLYYTRDVNATDGMKLLTTLGGNRWGSRHTTVPSGWDSMIRGYMGNGQPKTTGGSTYEVTYDAERVFGDTNEAGGGDYTYILCKYADVHYVDIDRQTKYPNAVTELTNTSSTLSAGWYIVRGQNVQTGTLTCNGAVNIILADGAKLTATGQANGIQVSAAGSSLAIYGQTAQSGQLTAIGGTGASAIYGGSPGAASPIYVNTSLTVCADDNNPPTTFVDYTIGEDVSGSLSGKRYVTMRIPQNITVTLDRQGGTGGTTQVTAKEGSAMPTISVPTRTGYTFLGYYASQNGTGTKYYNADGTSAHKWDRTNTATLYAHWTNQYTVTFDMQNGIGGTESATATYGAAMPEITIPTREGCEFLGYFSQPNGRGTKYYNADGTSAHVWNVTNNTTTLYAQWKVVRAWYIDADGSSKSVTDFTMITDKSETATLSSGWYIVNDANVQTRTLVCEGAVNLILMDGAKLTATDGHQDAGIQVSDTGASLTIYGQQEQTGQLFAIGNTFAAGIGGGLGQSGQNITINGGVITAQGGYLSAGIGGGTEKIEGDEELVEVGGSGHNITINGGVITATGGDYGAGIGGGNGGTGQNITINGGVITTTGRNCGAGIGGGDGGTGQNITINGGVITATGGQYAAGIGGGDNRSGNNITINGGVINATCDDASVIGGGRDGGSFNIHINSSLILTVNGTEIEHTSTDDMAPELSDKKYATLTLPSVNVNKVPEQDVNYGTFYHKYADYTVPNEEATIYTASVEDVQGETCLVLHKLESNVIPANTAVILRTEESSTIDLQPCADASGISVPANSLSGANLPMDAPANCYIMSYGQNGLGFYKYAQGKDLTAHKAYLIGSATASPTSMTLIFAGNATGNKETDDKANTGSSDLNQE